MLHQFADDNQALRYFRDLAERAKFIAWLIQIHRKYGACETEEERKRVVPKKPKPTNHCKTNVLGLANNIGDWNYKVYVPDYSKPPDYPKVSLITLEQKATQMEMELKDWIRQLRRT